MAAEEKKNKRKGIIVTTVTHVLLLILFAIYGLKYPDPPPPEEGITINFGNTDFGQMSENPNPPAETSEPEPVEQNIVEPDPVETVEDEIVTQDNLDAPSINEKKEEKKEEVKPVEKKPEPKPNRALNMADKMNSKKNNNSSGGGDGTTDQSGNQGSLDGDPNSTKYKGGGSGDGIMFNLAGRVRKHTPPINDNSQDEGTVVVDIVVDKYGKVLRASPGARGSNTTSAILYSKAKKAALATKFNAKPDAQEEQRGTMTFIFILN